MWALLQQSYTNCLHRRTNSISNVYDGRELCKGFSSALDYLLQVCGKTGLVQVPCAGGKVVLVFASFCGSLSKSLQVAIPSTFDRSQTDSATKEELT